ncbi:hypothetical protein [Bdellovibrio svalbardensis]|uniref:Uncharacterized protein n=1 Tax=Bdellovibrio svalbardensis TaxID=2972972 RepID=A0ABT6DG88_9BACT|nr:hypothetical protein [Bdellovibrio svalbardensis]MDG0815818.1 hypothetical protein [Bdellovibrio svalbardensis]
MGKLVENLVHHVELWKSEWDLTAITQFIEFSMFNENELISLESLTAIINSSLGLKIDNLKVERCLQNLISKQAIFKVGDLYKLSEQRKSEILILQQERTNLDAIAAEEFQDYLIRYSLSGVNEVTWERYSKEFIPKLVELYGSEVFDLLRNKVNHSRTLPVDLIRDCFPICHSEVVSISHEIFVHRESNISKLILNHLNVYYITAALGLDSSAQRLLKRSSSGKYIFRILLDSNALLSIFSLHKSLYDDAILRIFSFRESLKGNIDLHFYVMDQTLEETTNVLIAANRALEQNPLDGITQKVFVRQNLHGVRAKFYEATLNKPIPPKKYFEPYTENFPMLLREKDIQVLKSEDFRQSNLAEVQALTGEAYEFQKKLKEDKQREYKSLEHDSMLVLFCKKRRSDSINSLAKSEYWVLSQDFSLLIPFDKKVSKGSPLQRHVLEPLVFLELLSFWSIDTDVARKMSLENLNFFLSLNKFDSNAEKVSISILEGLAAYKDHDQLTESQVEKILEDQALRVRINSLTPEEKKNFIREAALGIFKNDLQRAMDESATLESYVVKKNEQLRSAESDLLLMREGLSQKNDELIGAQGELEAIKANVQELEKFKILEFENRIWKYIFFPLTVCALIALFGTYGLSVSLNVTFFDLVLIYTSMLILIIKGMKLLLKKYFAEGEINRSRTVKIFFDNSLVDKASWGLVAFIFVVLFKTKCEGLVQKIFSSIHLFEIGNS